jgi:hypothetical protein
MSGWGRDAGSREGGDVRGEIIPLRPLTLAEILDAAVEVLRRNARGLLTASALLAVMEQALLYPLRTVAAATPPLYWPHLNRMGSFWLLLAAGLATEAAILALLGGLAARAAVPALADGAVPGAPKVTPPPRWLAGPGARLGALAALAALVGLGAALTSAAGFAPWVIWYLFTGLSAPALIIERRDPLSALGRSFALVGRGGLRPGFIRLLGYLAWLAIRIALAAGGLYVLEITGQLAVIGQRLAGTIAWVLINTVAYAALGCLDAVLHLETRMRVEGLDLALGRALRRGIPAAQILAGR